MTTSPGESIEIAPDGAAVPARVDRAAERDACGADGECAADPVGAVAALQADGGEMATPPEALIVERVAIDTVCLGSSIPSNCASGPMKTSVAVIDVSPFRRTAPSR